jgi:hypothetical protein
MIRQRPSEQVDVTEVWALAVEELRNGGRLGSLVGSSEADGPVEHVELIGEPGRRRVR